ncbi:hypothetical protein HU830_07210 [Lactobacillus sp. DCY120]|uniref:Uncharacterized protein n=1 Tax=Bombilactobacillus apium TaxID=2675299 RepID=A0A850R7W1_9LACO|nr:hypothetical protein [Bombilactobacillus apium]NVY96937.1 hypothetical protein [Bombilactobacillus apium]
MQALVQTSNDGRLSSIQLVNLPQQALAPLTVEVQVTTVPLLPYDLRQVQGELPGKTPRVLGYGAVGKVTKVGQFRNSGLLQQGVLVLNPRGTWQESLSTTIPPFLMIIPEGISDQ